MRKTEAIIDLGCFERFHLQCPSEVAVNVKEFKAVLNFADFCGMSVNLHFDQPGKPLIVAVEENIDFCAEFVLATFQSSYYEEENAEAVAPVCNLNDIAEMAVCFFCKRLIVFVFCTFFWYVAYSLLDRIV